MKPNAAGLVPCVIRVSEAGLGLRRGEVRGLSVDVAKSMVAKGTARALTDAEIKSGVVRADGEAETEAGQKGAE